MSIYVGTAGIALLGQLINVVTIFMTISTGGINNGVTKYIAEFKKDQSKTDTIILTSIKISFICSFFAALLVFALSDFLSYRFLHSTEYSIVFLIFSISILFYSLNRLILCIINGFKDFKKFVIVNIIVNTTGLVFTIILVLLFEIKGALIAYVSSQSVIFLLSIFFVRNEPWIKRINFKALTRPINAGIAKDLSGFSVMTFVSVLIVPVVYLGIRNFIIKNISIEDAGLWESLHRISNLYLMLITASISVYFLPRIAELKSKALLLKELKETYKLLIPICIVISFFIYLLRNTIIRILFTPEFLPLGDLMIFQLIGDIFKLASYLLTYFMIAKRMIWTFTIMEVLFSLNFLFLNYLLINRCGLVGSTYAYCINYFSYFFVAFLIFRYTYFNRKINF